MSHAYRDREPRGRGCAAYLTVGGTARRRVARAVDCRPRPTGPVTAHITDTLAGLRVPTGKARLNIAPPDSHAPVLQLSIPHTNSLSKTAAAPAGTRCSHTKA
ncbi:hypothetical protein OG762_01535 [Streptomyces sp. NBC_01136]|uniref:hypothetical protein n=1 Tax=unclassified Streptomyces TaxID=2593676 RepID=UPI00324592F3|nr:hypothetical protein OG762_01535 [Streptomyces sp. NBC_01136]